MRENSELISVNCCYYIDSSFFLNRPLLPCGVEGFLLVNLLDIW
jgi:hypothetical protein